MQISGHKAQDYLTRTAQPTVGKIKSVVVKFSEPGKTKLGSLTDASGMSVNVYLEKCVIIQSHNLIH